MTSAQAKKRNIDAKVAAREEKYKILKQGATAETEDEAPLAAPPRQEDLIATAVCSGRHANVPMEIPFKRVGHQCFRSGCTGIMKIFHAADNADAASDAESDPF